MENQHSDETPLLDEPESQSLPNDNILPQDIQTVKDSSKENITVKLYWERWWVIRLLVCLPIRVR